MADVNVAGEIKSINTTLLHHDKVLDKVGEVLTQQAAMTERQLLLTERISEDRRTNHAKFEGLDRRIRDTNKIVTRWGGAIVALGIMFTMIMPLIPWRTLLEN